MMDKLPDIFNFSDYRKYLKQWIEYARQTSVSNLSRLSETAGVHTTFLSHVLAEKKNLNLEQATLLSEALSHTKIEREYFFILIELDKAGSEKLRAYWKERKSSVEFERKKLTTRVGEHHELTDQQRAIFYSSWIYVAIFVATAIHDGQSLDEIADRFKLSRNQAEDYLSFLVQTGICEKQKDHYTMGKAVIYVPNNSPFVIKHHTNWRIRAMQKMDSREEAELFFTSPMSLAKKDIEKIREVLAKAIQNSLEICKNSPAEEVVCLNIDFFRSVS